jgi:hypothetical protein
MQRGPQVLVACLCSLLLGMALATLMFAGQSVKAQGTATRGCDYTYIEDTGQPNLGKNGAIKYDDSWKAVVEGGWSLKTASAVGSSVEYVFEKCR